eukprot:7381861-Prymnesium_polylepis.1
MPPSTPTSSPHTPREAGEAGEERKAGAPRLRAALRAQHGCAPESTPGVKLKLSGISRCTESLASSFSLKTRGSTASAKVGTQPALMTSSEPTMSLSSAAASVMAAATAAAATAANRLVGASVGVK